MIYPFSESTLEILHGAGWSEQYSHDVTEDIKLLIQNDYTPFPCVLDFLQLFGGLEFDYPDPIVRGSKQSASFNIAYAIDSTLREHIRIAEEVHGINLCLLGMCYSDDMWLTMDEEGYV